MTQYTKQETILKAENISLCYGDKTILHDINFNIKNIVRPNMTQGQVVSLIGRSGIGKTQLFKLLSGLQEPTTGTISIYDNKPVKAGDMGVIFQNYYLIEWRTVYQSLLLAARQNKSLKGKEKDAIENYAAHFELKDHLHLYPQQLSGGQRQRASIIQQLLKGSDFLLLDEPFSGLDVCVLDRVVDLLIDVSLEDELKTLIIVSHDIVTTVAISDTVFILGTEKGKPGSTIKKEMDLIERDLAWKKDIKKEKAFIDTVEEIKSVL
jgi:polar amino acid transport system ATP-binding protein/sulfate transport system ATP-binding protein/NitT/TauT family transport system ATP-binding protein